ncbi:hypothetical protein [Saccharopolyspora dendranthemae]|uniref:Uncharacterized protein n=1 Tax=Saccharopolyspora dendranthemae TaxID=1181886 RepID=A0A561TZD3_9PSEU|nr:hypothetical protein [Saccharopolyspora dendranthemae]TWF92442.1 hypothetical protein FHU35_1783 [Saccharopolyspora dendranthemae]
MARGGADSAEDQPERQSEKKTQVSPAQVGGAALASVTAAFLGSRLGVAGTVVGAALTSVIITVGGALYQRSIEKTKEKAVVAAARASVLRQRRVPPGQVGTEVATRKLQVSGLQWPGGEAVEGPATELVERETRTVLSPPVPRRRWGRWTLVGATCSAVFAVSMLLVTGFEGVTGRPLSGGDDGTTLGQVFRPVPRAPVENPPAEPTTSEPAPTSEMPTTEPSAPPTSSEQPRPSEQPPTPSPSETGSSATQSSVTQSAPESTVPGPIPG